MLPPDVDFETLSFDPKTLMLLDGQQFDARNGSKLYSFNTGGPIAGGVITWEQGGKQRVAATPGNAGQGWNLPGSPTIIIFGL